MNFLFLFYRLNCLDCCQGDIIGPFEVRVKDSICIDVSEIWTFLKFLSKPCKVLCGDYSYLYIKQQQHQSSADEIRKASGAFKFKF